MECQKIENKTEECSIKNKSILYSDQLCEIPNSLHLRKVIS